MSALGIRYCEISYRDAGRRTRRNSSPPCIFTTSCYDVSTIYHIRFSLSIYIETAWNVNILEILDYTDTRITIPSRSQSGKENVMKRRKISPIRQAREELIKEIEALNQSMEIANSHFENVSDPDLIDSYIYEMNAISFRYKYLIRLMRSIEAQGNLS